MEEVTPIQVPIRAQLMPDYYPEFHCIASKCRDSCCRDWRITLTKNDYMTLRKLCRSGELEVRFGGGVSRIRGEDASDNTYAQFSLQEGNCPFLNGQGLCVLQLECGEDSLSYVCRTFPRSVINTPWGLEERGCSAGCEAVLHLLYERKEGLGFLMEDIPEKAQETMSFSLGNPLGGANEAVRELCIDILQERSLTLPHRMLLLGWVLQDLRQGTPDDMDQWLHQKRALLGDAEVTTLLERFKGNKPLFVLHNIKQLAAQTGMSAKMAELCSTMFAYLEVRKQDGGVTTVNMDAYCAAEAAVLENYGDLEFFFENILVNAFFHYGYPVWGGMHDIWMNYVFLCNIYSGLRFFFVASCHDHSDLQHLFHVITMANRNSLHAQERQTKYVQALIDTDSASLADMAILVCG